MKSLIQIKSLLFMLVVAFVALVASIFAPETNADLMLATGPVAAAMLFNAGNLSSWRQRVDAFVNANGKTPDSYPIEWTRLVLEAPILTATTSYRFFIKEDPNQAQNREIRLGLNDVFFGFASQFRFITETLATPFDNVPQTIPPLAAHNVFYETGNVTLGSGNVNVWAKHSLAQYRYSPGQSSSELSGFDGVNLCYPAPILSGRNDLNFQVNIGTPSATIVHATPNTNRYLLQWVFYGFRVTGLAKDIETSTYFV